MRKSTRRMTVIGTVAVTALIAVLLASVGLRQSAAFFRTPSEIEADAGLAGRSVRVGGLVSLGSVRDDAGVLAFTLADDVSEIGVVFSGVPPTLFREGQCVIAEGVIDADGRLEARRILAKHDENYRPPDIEAAPRLAQSCGRPAA